MLKVLNEVTTYYPTVDEFAADLSLYADKWVDEKAEEIMEHAHELYEDNTFRIILKMWACASEEYHTRRLEALRGIAATDDGWYPNLSSCQYERRKVSSIECVLDKLVFED